MSALPRSETRCVFTFAEHQTIESPPPRRVWQVVSVTRITTAITSLASSASEATSPPLYVFGTPVDFNLFALTLLGAAAFDHETLQMAFAGLAGVILSKLFFTGFKTGIDLTGVTRSNMNPEAKSVGSRVKSGWPVAVAYVFGFFAMPAILGWKPDAPHKQRIQSPAIHVTMGNAS